MLGLFEKKKKQGLDKKTPITEASYVVVDTELTGLDEKKDSIVSIGAVRMTGGCIDLGSTFYRVVNPRTLLSSASVLIHEITPSETASKPCIDTVLAEFLDFCGSAVLIGHFVSLDLAFLNREMGRSRKTAITNLPLDTFSIYEWLRQRNRTGSCPATPLAGCRLHEIARCFDITINGSHNAVMDAFTTAQLFQRFVPLLAEEGVRELGDLIRIGAPFKGGDHFRPTNDFCNF